MKYISIYAKKIISIFLVAGLLVSSVSPVLWAEAGEDSAVIINKSSCVTFETFDGSEQATAFSTGVSAMNNATVVEAPGTGHGNYSLKNTFHSSNQGILKIDLPLKANHTYEIKINYYFEADDGSHSDYLPWFTLWSYMADGTSEQCFGGNYDATYGTWKCKTIKYTPTKDFEYLKLIANKVNGYFDDIMIADITTPEDMTYLATDFSNLGTVEGMPFGSGNSASVTYQNDTDKGIVAVCNLGQGINASKMAYLPYVLKANTTYEITMTYKSNNWSTWCLTATNGNIGSGLGAASSWTTVTRQLTVPENVESTYFGLGTTLANTQITIASIRLKECRANSADYQMYDFDVNSLTGATTTTSTGANGVENKVLYFTGNKKDTTLSYPLTTGETYKLSFDYKGAGTLSLMGWPTPWGSGTQKISAITPETEIVQMLNEWVALKSENWCRYEVSFTATLDHKMLTINSTYQTFAGNYDITDSQLYFDNICIEKVEKNLDPDDTPDDEPVEDPVDETLIILNNKSALTFETYNTENNNTGLPAGVTTLNGATVAEAPEEGHGKYSLKNQYHSSNDGILKVDLPLQANHTYEIKINYYFEENTGAYSDYLPWFTLWSYMAGGTSEQCFGGHHDASYGEWKSTTITYTPASDVEYLKLIANKVNAYFDDITVLDKTSPETELYVKTDFSDIQTADWLPLGANEKASISYHTDEEKGIVAVCNLGKGVKAENMIYIPYALKENQDYILVMEYKSTAWSCSYFDNAANKFSFGQADEWKTVTYKFKATAGEQYFQIATTVDNATITISSLMLRENNNNEVYQMYDFDCINLSGVKKTEEVAGVDGTNSKVAVLNYTETGRDFFDSTLDYALKAEDIYKISFDYKGSAVLQLISYVKWGEGNQVLSDALEATIEAEGAVQSGKFLGLSSETWQRCEIVFQAGASHKMISFSSAYQSGETFKDIPAESKIYLDNICVERIQRAEDIVYLQPDENFEKITFSQFGIEDGKYEVEKSGIAVSGKSRYSLNETVLCGKLFFSEPGAILTVGGSTSGWYGMRFESRAGGKIYLYWIGEKSEGPLAVFDSAKAKTDLLGNWFDFKMSTQIVDADGDGQKDDIQLGVWFDDYLYRNEYITILNRASDLGRLCSIACNGAGPYLSIQSIPELVRGFDYAYFGLTENWEKELLDTGLSSEIAVGGSKDATPFSGDSNSTLTLIVLSCMMIGGIVVSGCVIRKRKHISE